MRQKTATRMLAGTMLAVLAGLMPAGTASARARPVFAARQLVTVTAASRGTTYATLRAYQVTGTRKTLVGVGGIAPTGRKREGDGRTPSGTYGFGFFFGVDPSPGVTYPYRHAYPDDYWDDDPASPRYNLWVDAATASPGRKPEPMHNVPAYDYAAVISYNTARTPGVGSAIFLHAATGRATAGCVSLPAAELVKVLRWLRQGDHPAITIAVSLAGFSPLAAARGLVGVVGRAHAAVHVAAAADGDRRPDPGHGAARGHRVDQGDPGGRVEHGQLTRGAVDRGQPDRPGRPVVRRQLPLDDCPPLGLGHSLRAQRELAEAAQLLVHGGLGQVRLDGGGELLPVHLDQDLAGLPGRVGLPGEQLLKRLPPPSTSAAPS